MHILLTPVPSPFDWVGSDGRRITPRIPCLDPTSVSQHFVDGTGHGVVWDVVNLDHDTA